MPLNVAEILHSCRFFAEVQDQAFERLLRIARIVKFEKGTRIFHENQECPGVYVVGSGLVRVFKTGSSGKEHTLHMVGPGDTFAEVAAIGGFRLARQCRSRRRLKLRAPPPRPVSPSPRRRPPALPADDHQFLLLGPATGGA